MTTREHRSDLTRLERMERRLQALEHAEAIRNLKAQYAALCDNQYDADGIAALFTEDALWESPALGRFEGREAIRGFFRGASGIFSFAIHYSLNGHIEVEGETARARWYLFMPCTVAAGNQAMWRAGIDHETYARVDGAWMFRHKRSEPLISVPFETGWARTRVAQNGRSHRPTSAAELVGRSRAASSKARTWKCVSVDNGPPSQVNVEPRLAQNPR